MNDNDLRIINFNTQIRESGDICITAKTITGSILFGENIEKDEDESSEDYYEYTIINSSHLYLNANSLF